MNSCCQTFRQNFVATMIKAQENFPCISRNCLFLAVSIFDHYLQKSYQAWRGQLPGFESYVIVCSMLACKLEGDRHPGIAVLKNYFGIQTPSQIFEKQILGLESKILITLDFCLPMATAYQHLDSQVDTDELSNQQKRRDVAKSIKIILTAIQIGSQLSLDPSLGGKIHQITKKTQVSDCRARNLYRKCLKFIKSSMEKVSA